MNLDIQTIVIGIINIEETYLTLKDKFTVVKELKKESYGAEFIILDPEGNQLEF